MPLRQLNMTGQGTNVIPVKGVQSQPLPAPVPKPFALDEQGNLPVTMLTEAQQASKKVSVSEFSQKIKEKYPEYASVDDMELAQKIINKYPEYGSKVDLGMQEQQKDGLLKQFGRAIVSPFARLAGQIPLAFGAGIETRPGAQSDMERLGVTAEGYQQPMQAKGVNVPLLGNFKPVGYDESGQQLDSMGKIARDVLGTSMEAGSYFMGAGQAAKGVQGVKSLASGAATPTLKQIAGRTALGEGAAGLMGGSGYGLQQEDATVGSVLGSGAIGAGTGAALGLVFPFAGAGVNKLRKGLRPGVEVAEATIDRFGRLIDKPKGNIFQRVGQGIEKRVIKPTSKDLQGGFKISNVNKYQLGGSLEQTFYKTQDALNSRMAQLNDLIKANGDVPVGTYQEVIVSLRNKFEGSGNLSQLGKKKDIIRALNDIESELDLIDPNWRESPLNFGDAVQLKRASGEYTSFLHDPIKGNQMSPTEEVWNALYRELMDVTEKNAPEQFKQVNKEISELIPIKQAVVRRIPVAERNNVIGISDLMGGVGAFVNPGALALPIMQRLFNSGGFANILMRMGGSAMPTSSVTKPLVNIAEKQMAGPQKIKTSLNKTSAVPLIESAQAKQARVLSEGGEIVVSPAGQAKVTPPMTRRGGEVALAAESATPKLAPPKTSILRRADGSAVVTMPDYKVSTMLKPQEVNEMIRAGMLRREGNRLVGGENAFGFAAGIEPELDKDGNPTGKFKFNAAKAMLGFAGISAAKKIAPKLAGKGDDLIQEAKKFKTAEEFVRTKPIKIFHVTEASNAEPILRTGFKAGSELPEDVFRGGGYGIIQKSISFADNPKDAFTFAISQKNSLMEAELKPGAKIKNLSGVEYAEELNDEIPNLLKDGFDAVKLVDSGEGEIVVINPKALQNIKNTLNFKGVEAKDLKKNYQSDGFTLKQLTDIWNQANKKTAQ